MENMTQYIPIIIAAGVFLDAISGYLPDKWLPYIGVVRRIVRAVFGIGKPKE